MKKDSLNNGFRCLLKASAFTTVMFIMQACYGAPQSARTEEEPVEIRYSGIVTDNATCKPLQGIRMEVSGYEEAVVTDENGSFDIMLYDRQFNGVLLTFSDENNIYAPTDTVIDSNYSIDMSIRLSAQ